MSYLVLWSGQGTPLCALPLDSKKGVASVDWDLVAIFNTVESLRIVVGVEKDGQEGCSFLCLPSGGGKHPFACALHTSQDTAYPVSMGLLYPSSQKRQKEVCVALEDISKRFTQIVESGKSNTEVEVFLKRIREEEENTAAMNEHYNPETVLQKPRTTLSQLLAAMNPLRDVLQLCL